MYVDIQEHIKDAYTLLEMALELAIEDLPEDDTLTQQLIGSKASVWQSLCLIDTILEKAEDK